MATGKRPPPGNLGARRRRPAPTIDLKATEIPEQAAATAAATQPPVVPQVVPQANPQVEPRIDTAAGPISGGWAATASSSRPLPQEPPIGGPDEPYSRRPEPQAASFRQSSVTWLPPELPWPQLAAGVAGGAGVLLLFLLLWLMLPRGGDPVASLSPRLAAIETQLRDLAARPVPAGVDPRAIDDVAARLAKVEATVAAPRPPTADTAVLGRLAGTESAVKSLTDNVTALSRRADEIAAAVREVRARTDTAAAALADLQNVARASTADHGEIAVQANRIAALERADRVLADELAKRVAAGNDRAVRLAVAASALRAAVERGDPFTAELAIVKPLTVDANVLAALESFAATGVPNTAALAGELIALLPPMLRATGTPPREGGFLDRLQANAERLVRVRPVEEVIGDDPMAILSRVEVKAAHADVNGALAELAKLPPRVRAPAQAWIAKAEARNTAVEVSKRFAAETIAGLKTAP